MTSKPQQPPTRGAPPSRNPVAKPPGHEPPAPNRTRLLVLAVTAGVVIVIALTRMAMEANAPLPVGGPENTTTIHHRPGKHKQPPAVAPQRGELLSG